MATGLSPDAVAEVLNQLYRAATGVPRRFYLRSEDLKKIARRERARREFFEEVGERLEAIHSILMSYPRLNRGGVVGFVSLRVAERWPTASASNIRDTLRERLDSDWMDLARKRLQNLRMLNQVDDPIRITEGHLCKMAQQRKFEQKWWLQFVGKMRNLSARERLTFFVYEDIKHHGFAVTHEDYVRKWQHLTEEFWGAAFKRYDLEEFDEQPDLQR